MDKSHIIQLWNETFGELPRIEYSKDKSFAVLYAEKNGDWLRKNYKLIMTWFNRYHYRRMTPGFTAFMKQMMENVPKTHLWWFLNYVNEILGTYGYNSKKNRRGL